MTAFTGTRSERARAGAWALAALALSGAPALAILASGRTFAWRDTATLFGPVRELAVDALRSGRLPLWNPYEGFGLPLLAQMIHGVLHPMSVAHAWFVPATGIEGLAVGYLAAAGLGAWLLARELGCSPAAAAVAGVAYGLSGYVQGLTAIIQYLAAGATAPWAVAGMRAAGRGSAIGLVAGAAGVAALHLAGDPQWTIAAIGLGLALGAASNGKGLAWSGFSVAAGTGIAAIQLLPSWDYLAMTVRASGLSDADKVQWALAPARLLEFVAPGFFGGRPGVEFAAPVFLWLGGPTQSNLSIPFLPSVHVGAVVLALAALGARSSRIGLLLVAASVLFLWLGLGPALGAQQLLGDIPIWGSFRYSEKLVGPVTLCLSVLGALGADQLAKSTSIRVAWVLIVSAGVLAVAGGFLLLPYVGLAGAGAPEAVVARAASSLGRGFLLSAAGLGLLGMTMLATRRGFPARGVARVTVVLVAASAVSAAPFAIRAGRRLAPVAPVVTSDPDPMVTRVASPLEDVPPANPLGLDSADLEVVARTRLGLASSNVASRIDQVSPYTGILPSSLRSLGEVFGPDLWVAMRRLGVTHVVHAAPRNAGERATLAAAAGGGTPVFQDDAWGIRAWSVPHRPYARFADRVSALPAPGAALEAMYAADLAGLPGVVVVGQGRWPTGKGQVLRLARGTERVEIEASAESDALLVVADAFWPGWRAEVDGVPVEIVRTDFLLRGVRFPAGRHRLVMLYDPPEIRLGWVVTGTSLLVLLAVASWASWRGARTRGTAIPSSAGR